MNKSNQIFILSIVLLLFRSITSFALDIHGYVSQGFLSSNQYNYLADTDGGTFQFNEMGINFVERASDDAFVGMQISARDLGEIGNDEPYIDWAVADWRITDIIGIRFGILKIPVGFYNETRDIDMLRTCVLLPSGVYLELFRDAWNGMKGFGTYGAYTHPFLGNFDYQCAVGTGEINDDSATAKMFNSVLDDSVLNVRKFQVDKMLTWGVQWHIPFYQLRLGNTFFFTDWNNIADFTIELPAIDEIPIISPGNHPLFPDGHPGFSGCDPININQEFPINVRKLESYTLSASIQLHDITFSSEYFHLQFKSTAYLPEFTYANDTLTDLDSYGGTTKSETKIEGYYFSATRRITDMIELGFYYSWITNDAFDKQGKQAEKEPGNHDYSKWLRDYCLSSLVEVTDQWTFKIEGHLMDGHSFLFIADNPPIEEIVIPEGVKPSNVSPHDAAYPDRFWFMIAAKVTFSF